jgi:hypothetical protein
VTHDADGPQPDHPPDVAIAGFREARAGVLVLAALSVGRAPAEVGHELLGGRVAPDIAGFREDRGQPDHSADREICRSMAKLRELGRDGMGFLGCGPP